MWSPVLTLYYPFSPFISLYPSCRWAFQPLLMSPTAQCAHPAHEVPSNPVPLFPFQHPKVTLSMIFLTISFHSPAHCTHPVPSNPIPLFTFQHTVLTLSSSSPTIPFQFPPSRAPYLPSRTVWNWYSMLAFSAISAIRSGMKPVYLVPSFFAYGSSCSKIANLKFHSNKFWFKKFHRLPDREKCLQGVFLSNGGLFYSKLPVLLLLLSFDLEIERKKHIVIVLSKIVI